MLGRKELMRLIRQEKALRNRYGNDKRLEEYLKHNARLGLLREIYKEYFLTADKKKTSKFP